MIALLVAFLIGVQFQLAAAAAGCEGFNQAAVVSSFFILVFQWRHFGAEYVDMHADYSGKGVDQLANVINLIRFHLLLAVQPHKC